MSAAKVNEGRERRPHSHRFDAVSGYCAGCGLRDDGRLVSRDGRVFREGAARHVDPRIEQQRISEIREAMKGQS